MRFNQCKRLQIEPGCKSWVSRFIQLASGTCKLVPIASWERNTKIFHHDIFQTLQKKQPLERASRKTQSSKILKCKEIINTRPFNSASNKIRTAANAAPERNKKHKMQVSLILYNLNVKLPSTWSSSLNSCWYCKTNHHLQKNKQTKKIKNERRNEKEKPKKERGAPRWRD